MIRFEHVFYRYKGNKEYSLEDCSFHIKSGEIILLCGRSGCGKTTVTKLMNGLIPHFQQGELGGKVVVGGREVANTPMWQLAENIGSVFQNPKSQFFNLNTTDEIVFGMENCGMDKEKMRENLVRTAKICRVEDLLDRDIFQLSGGEKQRIAVAFAYGTDPEFFVLDEPSSNLDIESMQQLAKLVGILKEQKKTVVIAEHRLWYLMDYIDRVFYFEQGKLKKVYDREEFLKLEDKQRRELGIRQLFRQSLELERKESTFSDSKGNLIVNHLSFRYGKHTIWEDVNFQVERGEIAAILGENGDGKTTLAKCLCGVLSGAKGDIFLDGKKLNRKSRRKKSFLIMQNVNNQLFADSVLAEAMLGNNACEDTAISVLGAMRLDLFLEKHPMSLSGGQKQRLAVATACLCEKELLIFDEPTSGLDYIHMVQMSKLLKKLAGMGKIVIVITHDEEFLSCTNARILSWNGSDCR